MSPPHTDKNTTTSSLDNYDSSSPLDVLIIGAGWAGLSTAKQLYSQTNNNNSKQRIRILEGRSTYGGRCRSQLLNDGVSIAEHGAQWIHGARKTNPVYQFALESGAELKRSAYESQIVYQDREDGSCQRVTKEKYDFMYDYLMEGKGGFYAYQEERQEEDDNDVSMQQCAEDFLNKINATDEQRRWMKYLMDMEIGQEYAAPLDKLSMFWWDSDEDIPGGDVEMPKEGYCGMLKKYVQEIEHLLEYNAMVTRIDWSQNDRVTVHYTQYGETKQVTAKRVVITIPIGVLQAKTIEFQPPLPTPKQRCIDRIGMGLLNKCLFLWDEEDVDQLPWPQDYEWMERVSGTDEQGLWTEYYNLRPVTGRPMLCAFTAGNVAREVERLSDADIQASALEALCKQFAVDSIPTPKQAIVTKWGKDEFTRGSYSFNAVGGKHSDRKKLAEPLDQKLYFAGEACHSQYFGTTQGALLSGINAAKQITKHEGSLMSKAKKVAKKVFQGKAEKNATTTTAVKVA